MHICLVGNNRTPVQRNWEAGPHPEEARSAVSKDGGIGIRASWFETRGDALLTTGRE
jgi:hypothetical protein